MENVLKKYTKNRSTEQAIADFILVHGSKYDYSMFIYTRAKDKGVILCRKHGEFKQCYSNHVAGRGCIKCGEELCAITSRKDTRYIVNKMKEKHGDRYIYDSVDYSVAKNKVIVTCRIHGDFNIFPHDHISGKGCIKCGNEKKRYGVGTSISRFKSASDKLNNGMAKFYIIKCHGNDEVFYKFGITNREIKTRFSGPSSMPYEFEVVELIESSAEDVYNCELEISKKCLFPYKPKIKFLGSGECVSHICKNTKNIIEKHLGGFNGLEK